MIARLTDVRSAVVVAVVAAGCDPGGAGVAGTITLSATDGAGFATLEQRFYPDITGGFDLAGPPEIPSESGDYMADDSRALATITFPFAYEIKVALGTTEMRQWRVTAWLATDATQTWPSGSEPIATAQVTISECGGAYDGYCGVTEGIDLALAEPATVR